MALNFTWNHLLKCKGSSLKPRIYSNQIAFISVDKVLSYCRNLSPCVFKQVSEKKTDPLHLSFHVFYSFSFLYVTSRLKYCFLFSLFLTFHVFYSFSFLYVTSRLKYCFLFSLFFSSLYQYTETTEDIT